MAGVNALAWSIIGMADATDRLSKVGASDRPRAFAVVSETLVSALEDLYAGLDREAVA